MLALTQVVSEFKKKTIPTEDNIISNWECFENKEALVSIACITYNHEKFIKDAINGFLIQKTNFPFEIIIHDDAYTDGTAEIIKEYAGEYPKIIKVILQSENQYSQGVKIWNKYIEPACIGKYIAVCEGDDFWCDPTKLQKQFDYLEANPGVFISSFDAFIIDENNSITSASKLPDVHHRDYSGEEMQYGKAWLLTMNWMYRNTEMPFVPETGKVLNGDTFTISRFGAYGGSHHHTDILPSAYRAHSGGVWSALSKKSKNEAQLNTYFWIHKYYQRINKEELSIFYKKKIFQMLFQLFFESKKNKEKNNTDLLELINSLGKYKNNYIELTLELTNKISNIKNSNNEIIIYGYGFFGKYLHEELKENVIAIIDKDSQNIPEKGYYPEYLEKVEASPNIVIIISVLNREIEIVEQLSKINPNLSNNLIFF